MDIKADRTSAVCSFALYSGSGHERLCRPPAVIDLADTWGKRSPARHAYGGQTGQRLVPGICDGHPHGAGPSVKTGGSRNGREAVISGNLTGQVPVSWRGIMRILVADDEPEMTMVLEALSLIHISEPTRPY